MSSFINALAFQFRRDPRQRKIAFLMVENYSNTYSTLFEGHINIQHTESPALN